MSFLSGLFGGSNPTLNSQIGTLGNLGNSSVTSGQQNQNTASSFFNSILSGDADKVLAPQIAGIKGQGQQQKQTLSQFGNRGGGTNATAQMSDDTTRKGINDLIASLTGSAATNLASLGTTQVGQGLSAYGAQATDSQDQLKNWQQSILGSGITGAINYGESFLPVAHGG